MLNRSTQEKGSSSSSSSQQQKGGLLTTRLLNSLPYSGTVKNLYNNTKNRNDVFRFGFNVAETAAGVVSSPFINKYVALDNYASAKLDKLQNNWIANTVGPVVYTMAFPVVYPMTLSRIATEKAAELASPALEMTYEWADVVVDKLMPPDSDETLEDEYRRMSSLQQKSPFRRIKERTTVNSVIRLPSNAFNLTINLFSSTLYMTLGFMNMSLAKMIHNTTILVDAINLHFEQHLDNPWTVSSGDASKLYHAMVFQGARRVNDIMNQLEHNMTELSEYLNDRKLPYNSHAVAFVADKLKDIERRLVRIGGIQIEPAETTIIQSTAAPSTPAKQVAARSRPRFTFSATRRVVSPDDRVPSMLQGVDGEEHIDYHKAELEALRAPTMLWGASKNKYQQAQRAKSHKDEPKKQAPKKAEEAVPEPEPIVEIEEPEVDPNADEYGYIPVRAKAHDHLIPANIAKKLGQNMLLRPKAPVTPTNSPAEPLFNNPYGEISTEEDSVVRGPAVIDNEHEASVKDKEYKAHEGHLRKVALHQMMREVSRRLKQDEDSEEPAESKPQLEEGWEAPKHPAHVVVEEPTPEPNPNVLPAPENNPFGKLAEVDASEDPLSMGLSAM